MALQVRKVIHSTKFLRFTPVGANWLWAWAMAVPAGSPNSEEAKKFIEWATSKDYIKAVGKICFC